MQKRRELPDQSLPWTLEGSDAPTLLHSRRSPHEGDPLPAMSCLVPSLPHLPGQLELLVLQLLEGEAKDCSDSAEICKLLARHVHGREHEHLPARLPDACETKAPESMSSRLRSSIPRIPPLHLFRQKQQQPPFSSPLRSHLNGSRSVIPSPPRWNPPYLLSPFPVPQPPPPPFFFKAAKRFLYTCPCLVSSPSSPLTSPGPSPAPPLPSLPPLAFSPKAASSSSPLNPKILNPHRSLLA